MKPATFKAIRQAAGLTQSRLAAFLRISDVRTIRRWETGEVPVSGPASLCMEMLDASDPAEVVNRARARAKREGETK